MTTGTSAAQDMFDAGGRGLQHHGLRRANERAVLTLIGYNSGLSNADIARLSGLAPQTVSAILADIEEAGLIARGPVLRGRRGQPATPIFLRPDGAFAIGVEIGWRHAEVLLVDMASQVRASRRWAYDFPDARIIVKEVTAAIADLRQTLSETHRARLHGIGVALPTNMIANADLANAPGDQCTLWSEIDLAGDLERLNGLEVTRFNDGNAACWGQLVSFPRPRPSNFIYFMLSRCLAAGIIGEGTLWEGPSGNSANLGAMLVSSGGVMQPAHFIASVTALEHRLTQAGMLFISGEFETWDWQAFSPIIDQWMIDSAKVLARVIFNTTMVMETGLVVLDTILPGPLGARIVEQVEAEMGRLPVPGYKPPRVVSGHLGAQAPGVGAAALTLYRRFFSRTLADLVG